MIFCYSNLSPLIQQMRKYSAFVLFVKNFFFLEIYSIHFFGICHLSFHKWPDWSLEKLSDLFKGTKLVTWLKNQVVLNCPSMFG